MTDVRTLAIASVVASALAACLAGCVAQSPEAAPSPTTTAAAVTHIATQPVPDARPATAVGGPLQVTEAGCWGLGGGASIFPEGTTIQPDGSGIILPDGFEIDLGENIETGGVGIEGNPPPEGIPEACHEELWSVLYFDEHLLR